MRRIQTHWPRWLAAALPAAALFAYAALFTNPHYDLGDDVILMRSFGGMVGGVYESVNLFTHTMLAWVIHGLSMLFPGTAWFSVAQLAALSIALYVIELSAMQAAGRMGMPKWTGWLAGVGFLAAFAAEPLSSVLFTATTAVLGAASVWRLLALDVEAPPAKLVKGMLGAFLPMLLAYSFRSVSMLPALAFWLGGVLCLWLIRRAQIGALLRGLGVCALALALMAGVRFVEVGFGGEDDYFRWQNANVNAIDYGGLSAAGKETLAEIGWTESQRELALNWCFLDEDMTAEAFAAIPPDTSGRNASAAVDAIQNSLRRSESMRAALYAQAGLCAVAALLALLGGKGRRLWPLLAAAGCGLGAAAMLFYLAWMGRLPARAAMTVLLPANAVALWLVLNGAAGLWQTRRAAPRAAVAAASLACALLLSPCVSAAYRNTYNPAPKQADSACTRLERYALSHGEELIIADLAFGEDRSLFPDWSAGKPRNLLLGWGGWNNHSKGYRAVFQRFGYEHDHFQIKDFLDSQLRLAVSAGAAPTEAFMTCLEEQAGHPVRAVADAREDGFWIYRFTAVTEGEGDADR